MSKFIIVNPERCLGCHSCVLQCAMAHSDVDTFSEAVVAEDTPQSRVHVEDTGIWPVAMQCQHCKDAPCVMVCPVDAIQRSEPGLPVLIDPEKCTGCGFCIAVCPFGAVEKQRGEKKAVKCDLCKDRPEGDLPACVSACPTRAIGFKESTEEREAIRQKIWDALMEELRNVPEEAAGDDPDEKQAACVVCGCRFAPKKLLTVLRKKTDDKVSVPSVCPACKRRIAAKCIAGLAQNQTPCLAGQDTSGSRKEE